MDSTHLGFSMNVTNEISRPVVGGKVTLTTQHPGLPPVTTNPNFCDFIKKGTGLEKGCPLPQGDFSFQFVKFSPSMFSPGPLAGRLVMHHNDQSVLLCIQWEGILTTSRRREEKQEKEQLNYA
uniref:MD-2-related lipid-recognition domain-containing protein n=1 Tax=Chromera velia CCMP2878 TaxID=1169474 RepID=A0A0G4GXI2_9ALVE|eukprot:Cvel_23786.t1-p1 / transcript=Cvel_23786.t1 / gene=Cvel_23786 / organism=Chromera_velia_CCMP2878 / gene_product=hypothetical protein / transcript_product=hypothetical protein / location=Cvel_scaffold2496:16615-18390(+) / protein_length=122 / sequence_SO=supercontig / SO=protein_coding / is_pseudo=false